jgi:hypothetical protein
LLRCTWYEYPYRVRPLGSGQKLPEAIPVTLADQGASLGQKFVALAFGFHDRHRLG